MASEEKKFDDDAVVDPCKKYDFVARLKLAQKLLDDNREDPHLLDRQVNLVQILDETQKKKSPNDAGKVVNYKIKLRDTDMGMKFKNDVKVKVRISPRDHAIASTAVPQNKIKSSSTDSTDDKVLQVAIAHSEQLILNNFDLMVDESELDKKDFNKMELIIISTNSPCKHCHEDKRIEKMCNGEKMKESRFDKCVYLYANIWNPVKPGPDSPPTPVEWDAALQKNEKWIIRKCDIPEHIRDYIDDDDLWKTRGQQLEYDIRKEIEVRFPHLTKPRIENAITKLKTKHRIKDRDWQDCVDKFKHLNKLEKRQIKKVFPHIKRKNIKKCISELEDLGIEIITGHSANAALYGDLYYAYDGIYICIFIYVYIYICSEYCDIYK